MQPQMLIAYANHGRWIVDCPVCKGAEIVKRARPEFHCRLCGLQAPVLFPERYAEIERVMAVRPIENRNWVPGETIDLLKFENQMHGLVPR